MLKERPILMSAPMVRSTLREVDPKTQTRRIAKPVKHPDLGNLYDPGVLGREPQHVIERACPYGQPGDRLWVREAWKAHTTFDHLPPRDIPHSKVWYLADDGYKAESRARASIHMPRWASRITLEVTEVRVQRLQEISDEDALAEGIDRFEVLTDGNPPPGWHRCTYQRLWERINGRGSWEANQWVWAISFRRVHG